MHLLCQINRISRIQSQSEKLPFSHKVHSLVRNLLWARSLFIGRARSGQSFCLRPARSVRLGWSNHKEVCHYVTTRWQPGRGILDNYRFISDTDIEALCACIMHPRFSSVELSLALLITLRIEHRCFTCTENGFTNWSKPIFAC